MRKFLVCRLEVIRKNVSGVLASRVASSDYFPMIVEMPHADHRRITSEEVLEKALDSISEGYRSQYSYIVVPLDSAEIVRRKPIREFWESVPYE